MTEKHYFVPAKNKKLCEKCNQPYSTCMNWVELFVIEGPKERDFFWKNEKANYVTDLFTFELVQTIPEFEENLKIITIESTKTMSYLLNKKGQVISWGFSENSEDASHFTSPTVIKELVGIQIVAVACGENHALALEVGMYVWSWGSNEFFQLSRDEYFDYLSTNKQRTFESPRRIEEINNIVRIAAGPYSSFAVHMNGTVYAWGRNSNCSLGIEVPQNVRKATELPTCPWVREMKNQKKSYFKPEKIREVEISGISLSKIRAMRTENMDLHSRIILLSKKVDFLEDEATQSNNRKLQKLWDSDPELKELIKMTDKREEDNRKIANQVAVIDKELQNLETEKKEYEILINSKDSELNELWKAIIDIEKEMKKLKKESKGIKVDVSEKQAKDTENEFTSKAETRKEQQAEFLNKEMEKNNFVENLNKVNWQIKEKNLAKLLLLQEKDPNIEEYKKMASIKKKQIAEQNILKFSSRTYREIQDIRKVNETIEMASVESLTKNVGKFSHPEEIFSISNQLYEILEKYVKEKFKISGDRHIGNTLKVWAVVQEIVKVALEVNQLKQTLCSNILKSSKGDIKAFGEREENEKQKEVRNILKGLGILDYSVTFDNFSQKIKEREKKASMKKLIDEGPKQKSGWRSCF